MKTTTKLFLLTAAFAGIATSAAIADDQQLQNRLSQQRAHDAQTRGTTTVAVYASDRGLGRTATRVTKSEVRFELRSNARGQAFGAFVSANK